MHSVFTVIHGFAAGRMLEKVLSVRKWADRCVHIYFSPNHSEENEEEIALWLSEKWRKQN